MFDVFRQLTGQSLSTLFTVQSNRIKPDPRRLASKTPVFEQAVQERQDLGIKALPALDAACESMPLLCNADEAVPGLV